MAAPLAQCAPRLIGESNTGSCRTHTPFSTTASIAQPTEQWLHTVRFTSIFPSPPPGARPSSAHAFFTSESCGAALPAPPPRPERRRKERRSIVGTACASPRCRPCTSEERPPIAAPPCFLVSNMNVSWRECRESEPRARVVAHGVLRQLVAAALFRRLLRFRLRSGLLQDARRDRGGRCDGTDGACACEHGPARNLAIRLAHPGLLAHGRAYARPCMGCRPTVSPPRDARNRTNTRLNAAIQCCGASTDQGSMSKPCDSTLMNALVKTARG